MKISQNCVAFSEYMNLNSLINACIQQNKKYYVSQNYLLPKKIDPSIQVQNQEAIDCDRIQPSHVLQ